MPKKRDKTIMPNTNDDIDLGESMANLFADALLGGILGSGSDDKDTKKKKEDK